jgi:hypothetical protein
MLANIKITIQILILFSITAGLEINQIILAKIRGLVARLRFIIRVSTAWTLDFRWILNITMVNLLDQKLVDPV